MSEYEEWRRKIREAIEAMDAMIRELERSMDRMIRKLTKDFSFERPLIYGFQISFTGEGKPIVREFGNVRLRPFARRPWVSEAMEPLTDVYEEKDHVVVVVEMPGVEKEKIDVRASFDKIIVSGKNENRKYYKEILLPVKVKPETAKAKYKNGILEIRVEKAEEERGRRIPVE